MVWKPKSCGTKTRRRGRQNVAPPKAACRTWVREDLPLDPHEGTCEKTSWTLSACVDSLRVSSTLLCAREEPWPWSTRIGYVWACWRRFPGFGVTVDQLRHACPVSKLQAAKRT